LFDIPDSKKLTNSPERTRPERTYHDRRRAELRAALYAGIAIRDAREETGLSQTEVAARIGIAQTLWESP
jgi:ribosome-binding protein aMBF1 (putative translation factor)